jgi:hypothetical protein
MEVDRMKLCTDCKHFEPLDAMRVDVSGYGICTLQTYQNPVTGRISVHGESFAYWQRGHSWFNARVQGACGREGRFFEMKISDFGPKVITLDQSVRRLSPPGK